MTFDGQRETDLPVGAEDGVSRAVALEPRKNGRGCEPAAQLARSGSDNLAIRLSCQGCDVVKTGRYCTRLTERGIEPTGWEETHERGL